MFSGTTTRHRLPASDAAFDFIHCFPHALAVFYVRLNFRGIINKGRHTSLLFKFALEYLLHQGRMVNRPLVHVHRGVNRT